MKNKQAISISLIVLVLILSAYALWWRSQHTALAPATPEIHETASTTLSKDGIENGRYMSSAYAFSIALPEGYSASSFESTDPSTGATTTTILLQSITQKGNSEIQIAIMPYDDTDTTLTLARITHDLPELHASGGEKFAIGDFQGITFTSAESGTSKTREAWFVAAGDLYQLSTDIANAQLVDAIIASWKWND